MNLLAIDTATEACSAALYRDGVLTSQYQLAPREHSRLILKMIDKLLLDADLLVKDMDAIAFGRGPGSFMGLRIAAGVIQGIAFAHDIPVVAVSTLKAIAQRAYEETNDSHVLTAIDARMGEVYWAIYNRVANKWILEGEEQVISPEILDLSALPLDSCTGAGSGWATYSDTLLKSQNLKLKSLLPECFPSAEVIAKIAVEEFEAGNVISAADAIPVYLRNDVAKKPKPITL